MKRRIVVLGIARSLPSSVLFLSKLEQKATVSWPSSTCPRGAVAGASD
jgi:hypothetical protein